MIVLLVALMGCVGAGNDPAAALEPVLLQEDYQVLQRGSNDRASCVVVLPDEAKAISKFMVTVDDLAGKSSRKAVASPIDFPSGARGMQIDDLAVGGPYTIAIAVHDDAAKPLVQMRRVLVGDLWILGGQSNMYGIDVIKEPLAELPYLNMLNVLHVQRDSHWCAGVPPIHRIPDSHAPFVIKAQHPEYSPDEVQAVVARKEPVGGIDCSYFFAHKLYAESGVPIGLIPCATGGAIAIWDPRNPAGSRYEFLRHQVRRAGGRVKGILFFQGEQDAIFGQNDQAVTKPSAIGPVSTYAEQFTNFIRALRDEVRDPRMPVIYAQICRHHNGPADRDWAWESVREQQRRLPETLAHAHCIPSIDLDVMDGLHLDYNSLRRMGERMARVALRYVKHDESPRSEIRLVSAKRVATPKPRIVLEFSGVSGRLLAPGRPTGFVFKKSTDETLEWIFKAEFDPTQADRVVLWTTTMPTGDVALYYGAGPAPYVNIVDEADMPLPAFGPIHPE